jgi:membrane protease YdiL (CAAX protease family)
MFRPVAPAALVTGAVRGWHIVLLYGLIFVSVYVASAKLAQHVDPDLRNAWRMLVMQGASTFLVAIVTLAVPELRKAIPGLYRRKQPPGLDAGDCALFTALMVAWSFGAYRILILLPLLHWNPSLFSFLGFTEHSSHAGSAPVALFILAAISIIAPLAEELVFRGYLLNLWLHRWGAWPAILMSSLVFGLGHFQFAAFAGVAGIFFALVYLRFGSLWPSTILHGLYNLVGGPYGIAGFFLEKKQAEVLHLSAWIPELVLALAFFPLLFLFWRRFRPST